jgi:hypothetical protein
MFIKNKSELKPKFRALFEQAEHLIETGSIDVEVKKHINKRSNAQNNYYWLICSEVAQFLDEAGLEYGELDYSSDIIHALNKKKTGTKTTTKLSIKEFCDYMTRIINYWQEKTSYSWMPSELPATYLISRGYTDDYFH